MTLDNFFIKNFNYLINYFRIFNIGDEYITDTYIRLKAKSLTTLDLSHLNTEDSLMAYTKTAIKNLYIDDKLKAVNKHIYNKLTTIDNITLTDDTT